MLSDTSSTFSGTEKISVQSLLAAAEDLCHKNLAIGPYRKISFRDKISLKGDGVLAYSKMLHLVNSASEDVLLSAYQEIVDGNVCTSDVENKRLRLVPDSQISLFICI